MTTGGINRSVSAVAASATATGVVITAHLPLVVYRDTIFTLRLTASDPTYAGAGATAELHLLYTRSGLPDLISPVTIRYYLGADEIDVTRGWVNGVWEAEVIVRETLPGDRLYVRVNTATPANGVAANVPLLNPTFRVQMPTTVKLEEPFLLQIRATTVLGLLLTKYRPNTVGLLARLNVWKLGGWNAIPWASILEGQGGTAPDLESGWSFGMWEKTVRLVNSYGYQVMRWHTYSNANPVGWWGDPVVADLDILASITAPTLVRTDNRNIVGQQFPFTVEITLTDDADPTNQVVGYSGATAVLNVYGLKDTGWAPFSSLVTAGGTPVDITSGWASGKWSRSLRVTDDENCQCIALLLYDSGKKIGEKIIPITNGVHDAIKERQQAAGILDPEALIDVSGNTLYTLDQLKAFVANIAQHFTSDSVGNPALKTRKPLMYTEAWVNAATTRWELLHDKVWYLDIMILRYTDLMTLESEFWWGEGNHPTMAGAMANAVADYRKIGEFNNPVPLCTANIQMVQGMGYTAVATVRCGGYSNQQPLWTGVAKDVLLTIQTRDQSLDPQFVFNKQGAARSHFASPNEWADVGAAQNVGQYAAFPAVIPPNPNPAIFTDPATIGQDASSTGFELGEAYITVYWNFAYPWVP